MLCYKLACKCVHYVMNGCVLILWTPLWYAQYTSAHLSLHSPQAACVSMQLLVCCTSPCTHLAVRGPALCVQTVRLDKFKLCCNPRHVCVERRNTSFRMWIGQPSSPGRNRLFSPMHRPEWLSKHDHISEGTAVLRSWTCPKQNLYPPTIDITKIVPILQTQTSRKS
jgi:hypothetical protein